MSCTISGYRYVRQDGSAFPTIFGTGQSLAAASGQAIKLFSDLYSGCASGSLGFDPQAGDISYETNNVHGVYILQLTPTCVGVDSLSISGTGFTAPQSALDYNVKSSGQIGTGCRLCFAPSSLESGYVLQTGNTYVVTAVYSVTYRDSYNPVYNTPNYNCTTDPYLHEVLVASGTYQSNRTGTYILKNIGDNQIQDIHAYGVDEVYNSPYENQISWTGAVGYAPDFGLNSLIIWRATGGGGVEEWDNAWGISAEINNYEVGDYKIYASTSYQGFFNFSPKRAASNVATTYKDVICNEKIVGSASVANIGDTVGSPSYTIFRISYFNLESLTISTGIYDEPYFFRSSDLNCSGDCSTLTSGYFDDCGGIARCRKVSGSFSINRTISTCADSQAEAEAKFNNEVPAGAFGTSYITTSGLVILAPAGEVAVDTLINKDLFDTGPLREQLAKLSAKLNHYSEILSCKRDSVDSVKNFHMTSFGAEAGELATMERSTFNYQPPIFNSSPFYRKIKMVPSPYASNNFYGIASDPTLTSFSQSDIKNFGGPASHLFVVDPDDDTKVYNFSIPTFRVGGDTKFNPAITAPNFGESYQDNFVKTVQGFAQKISNKISKIRKFLGDELTFCSEVKAAKGTLLKPSYVFENLNYTIQVTYDEISYDLDDCVTKVETTTIEKTKSVTSQTFSPDDIKTIEIN